MSDDDVLDDALDDVPEAPDHPSLLRPSMFFAGWWISVVGGLALVGYALVQTVPALSRPHSAFWMIAGLLLMFELSPVIVGSGYDSQGVATSDAFTFAILYLYGPWPAIALISCATLVSEIVKRKPLWKVPYNIGQFALSLGSAALIMALWQGATGRAHPVPRSPTTHRTRADRPHVDRCRLARLLLRQQHALLDAGRSRSHVRR